MVQGTTRSSARRNCVALATRAGARKKEPSHIFARASPPPRHLDADLWRIMRVGQLGRHEEPELLVVLHCRIAQADPQSGRTLLVVHTDGFVRHVERECDSVFVSTDSLSKLRQVSLTHLVHNLPKLIYVTIVIEPFKGSFVNLPACLAFEAAYASKRPIYTCCYSLCSPRQQATSFLNNEPFSWDASC